MMMFSAIPKTNPFNTGLEMKSEINPNFRIPAIRKSKPQHDRDCGSEHSELLRIGYRKGSEGRGKNCRRGRRRRYRKLTA